jgi:hypothetical protein
LLVFSSEIPHNESDTSPPTPSPPVPQNEKVLKNEHLIRKKKFLFGWGGLGQLISFLLERDPVDKQNSTYFNLAHPGTNFSGSTKVKILTFFHSFFYTSVHNSKIKKTNDNFMYIIEKPTKKPFE